MSARGRLLEPDALFGSELFRHLLRERFGLVSLQPQQRLGAFRILRELGRGGMGVVYLAERADGEYEQHVAVKWLPDNTLDPASLALFRHERQVLAELCHPNIARLLDGGRCEDGHLWFAMELVEGLPIDQHAGFHQLPSRERVQLMLPVLEAVAFAHARLLIHCDIKPSNVLIDADGHAKLLDFGICTVALERRAVAAYSPDFASPEQRARQRIGTASDIWQLGRLLEHVLRTDSDAAPPRDLAAIIAKATAAEPSARYLTVAALRDDLLRYLKHRPVCARRGGVAYHGARLLRRHPWGSALICLSVVTITALIAIFMVRLADERDRAQTARNEAVAINSFLNEDLLPAGDPSSGTARDTQVSELMEAGLVKVESRLRGHSVLAGELDRTLGRVLLKLGRLDSAALALDRAVERLRTSRGPVDPATADARYLRAQVEHERGHPQQAETMLTELHTDTVHAYGRNSAFVLKVESAIAWSAFLANDFTACAQRYDAVLARIGTVPTALLGETLGDSSMCLSRQERYDEALVRARRAQEVYRQAEGADHLDVQRAQLHIANALTGLGQRDEAVELISDLRARAAHVFGEEHGLTLTYTHELGYTLLCAERLPEALVWLQRAEAGRTATMPSGHTWLAQTRSVYALALLRSGRWNEADALFAKVEASANLGDDADPILRMALHHARGELRLRQRRYAEAAGDYRAALAVAYQYYPQMHIRLAQIEAGLALSEAGAQGTDAAMPMLKAAIGHWQGQPNCSAPVLSQARTLYESIRKTQPRPD